MIKEHLINIARKTPFINEMLGVSSGHTAMEKNEAMREYWSKQWQNETLPEKQRQIVEKEIQAIKAGHIPKHMQVLIDMIRSISIGSEKILEIGCSSGYYNEIFKNVGIQNPYEGCDYSEKFIELAKKLYPNTPFQVCDSTRLTYENNSYPIVISGCCLLHISDYPKAITETVRVSSDWILWSRTPVFHEQKTLFTKKKGYGIDMVEIIFQEEELVRLFREQGLIIQDIRCIGRGPQVRGISEQTFIKTYLCRKNKTS